jgi:hypothetical protein
MLFHGQWRTMSDDPVVSLLEEIRDIQKQKAANDKVAFENQQEAMAMPSGECKGASRRLWARWYWFYPPGRDLPRVSPLLGFHGTLRR